MSDRIELNTRLYMPEKWFGSDYKQRMKKCTHMTEHGLPAGLEADWNDCLRMGEKGESSFLSF